MKLKLRQIRTQPVVERGQQGILLSDPLGISQKRLFISSSLAFLLTLMDGTRDIGMLITGFELRTGVLLSNSLVEQLASKLDEVLFLENERFSQAYEVALEDYRSAPSRRPLLAGEGCPENAGELRASLEQYLDEVEDEGHLRPTECKGLISPHIDFARGGRIYAGVWSKAKASVRQAELVVILGTDHNEGEGMITLTRQNYETPFGVIPTAQDVVDEMVSQVGEDVFAHELNHKGEHSIEAAVTWLHYLLGNKPCYILPVLCGSFQPFMENGESPLKAAHIASTIEVLKRVASRRPTVIVAAADLAHMGPAFGDPSPLDIDGRTRMAEHDKELIDMMSSGQVEDFFTTIRREKDCRRVCGVPPIYIALSVLSGVRGTPVGYKQCPAGEDGASLVSICGVIY